MPKRLLTSFFSSQTLHKKKSLSLQFIISELVLSYSLIVDAKESKLFQDELFFASKVGPFDKITYYLEVLFSEETMPEIYHSIKRMKTGRNFDEARSLCKEILDNITLFFEEFKEDENFLFSLCKHKNELDQIVPNTFNLFLKKTHPNGSMHQIIVEGYSKRGFKTFLSENEHLINHAK